MEFLLPIKQMDEKGSSLHIRVLLPEKMGEGCFYTLDYLNRMGFCCAMKISSPVRAHPGNRNETILSMNFVGVECLTILVSWCHAHGLGV
jgi:hypothetical protein